MFADIGKYSIGRHTTNVRILHQFFLFSLSFFSALCFANAIIAQCEKKVSINFEYLVNAALSGPKKHLCKQPVVFRVGGGENRRLVIGDQLYGNG